MTTKKWGYHGGDWKFEVLTVVTMIWNDSLGSNYEAYASHWFPQQLLMNITISHSFTHSPNPTTPFLLSMTTFLSHGACTLKMEATGSSKTLVHIYHHFTSYKRAVFSHHIGNIFNIFRLLLTLHFSSLLSFLALFQNKLGSSFHSFRHTLVWLMFHFPHTCCSVTCWRTIKQSYIRAVHETCQFHTIWHAVQTATCKLSLCLSIMKECWWLLINHFISPGTHWIGDMNQITTIHDAKCKRENIWLSS